MEAIGYLSNKRCQSLKPGYQCITGLTHPFFPLLCLCKRSASICSLHLACLLNPLRLSQLGYSHSAKMKTTGICLSCLPTTSFKAKKAFDACVFLDQYLVVAENFLDMTHCINSGFFFFPSSVPNTKRKGDLFTWSKSSRYFVWQLTGSFETWLLGGSSIWWLLFQCTNTRFQMGLSPLGGL